MDQNLSKVFRKELTNKLKLQSFIDRYTTRYFDSDNTYYFHHTNNLIIMGLTEKLIQKKGQIKGVKLVLKDASNLTQLVKGKKKKGGLIV